MAYKIDISEKQRVALHDVLLQFQRDHGLPDSHELAYWIDMLADLPNIEAQNPGILHGFCL